MLTCYIGRCRQALLHGRHTLIIQSLFIVLNGDTISSVSNRYLRYSSKVWIPAPFDHWVPTQAETRSDYSSFPSLCVRPMHSHTTGSLLWIDCNPIGMSWWDTLCGAIHRSAVSRPSSQPPFRLGLAPHTTVIQIIVPEWPTARWFLRCHCH